MTLLHFLLGTPLNDLALGHDKHDSNGKNEHGEVGKISAQKSIPSYDVGASHSRIRLPAWMVCSSAALLLGHPFRTRGMLLRGLPSDDARKAFPGQ